MADTRGEVELEIIESKINEIFKNNVEIFHEPHLEGTNTIKQLSQKSYSVAFCDELFKGRSLSKLLIDGFDEEQIWQQSDLLNKAASSYISNCISNINSNNILSVLSATLSKSPLSEKRSKSILNKEKNKSTKEEATNFIEESSAEEDYAFDDDSDSESDIDFNKKLEKDQLSHRKSQHLSDDGSDCELPAEFDTSPKKQSSNEPEYAFDVEEESDSHTFDTKPKEKQLSKRQSKYASIVDDQFFKLSKLENFLRIEDLKEERGEDSASDDDIDLFQDIPSDDVDITDEESEEQQGSKVKKSARNLMYEDFFDDPESEVEEENNFSNDKDESLMEENEKYSFDESESDADEMETDEKEENKMPENSLNNARDKKTKFELEQEKIKKRIQECEKSMLEPLPWHLTGEVAADKRPVNSLLDQEADFDCNTKQDLLVDKDLTEKIEEITIMAIRNKAFFDVERKYKPTEEIISYKKEIALEQTKSKKSLAEVYEEDYLKKQYKQDADEEENPKHKEIRKVMDSLFPQLHALFSHIPKPAIPEIKVVSNIPAITVEEVAPTNVSDATLLAPEEVKKKTGLIKGKTERTDTDRKRERRKKKIHQRLKEKKKLKKLESQKENPSAKVSNLEKLQTLKKLKQHKNTKVANIDESGKIKSSKDFFSRLQDTMDTQKKTRLPGKKIKNK